MKKVRTGILAAALLLSIGVTGAFAADPGTAYRLEQHLPGSGLVLPL